MAPYERPDPANDSHEVRIATPFDRHVLQGILEEGRSSAFGEVPSASDLLAVNRIHIARVRGEAVGCIATTGGDLPLIHALVVVAAQRAKGHACGLIEAALAEIPDDREMVWTAVDPELAGAGDRFARHGFVNHPDRRDDGLVLMVRSRLPQLRNVPPPVTRRTANA